MTNTNNITINDPIFTTLRTELINLGATSSNVTTFLTNVVNLINEGNNPLNNASLLVEQMNDMSSDGWQLGYSSAGEGVTDNANETIQLPVNLKALTTTQTATKFVSYLAYEVGHAEDLQANTIKYNYNALSVGAEVALDLLSEGKSLYNQATAKTKIPTITLFSTPSGLTNPTQAVLADAAIQSLGQTGDGTGALSNYWDPAVATFAGGTYGLDSNTTILDLLNSMNMKNKNILPLTSNGVVYTQNSDASLTTMSIGFVNSGSGNGSVAIDGKNLTISSYSDTFGGYGAVVPSGDSNGKYNGSTISPAALGSNETFVLSDGSELTDGFSADGTTETIDYYAVAGSGSPLYQEVDTRATDGGPITAIVISGSGDSVYLSTSSSQATDNGSSNYIELDGTSETATLNGTNSTTGTYGAGNTIFLKGSNNTEFDEGSGGNTLWLEGNTDHGNMYNNGDTCNDTGVNDTEQLSGNNIVVNEGGSFGDATIYGTSDTVNVTDISNTVFDLCASDGKNTISLQGIGNIGDIYNSGADTITLGGTGNSLSFQSGAGSGSTTITGTSAKMEIVGNSSESVTFGSTAAGVLRLDVAEGFTGTVAGYVNNDDIILADFSYSGNPVISGVTGTGAQGTDTDVTVTDGSKSMTLALLNQFANQYAVSKSAYSLSADNIENSGGTLFQLASAH